MRWAYPLFLVLLCGFGVVYLVWSGNNDVAANYGLFAVNASLMLAALSFTQSAVAWRSGDWPRSASQGFSIGLWLWVGAGLLQVVRTLFVHKPALESMEDFLWVTGYLPMFAGLFPRFQESKDPGKRGSRLVFLVLIAGYVIVFYEYLLPHLRYPERGFPAAAIDVLYVSFNFMLLGIFVTISRELTVSRNLLRVAFRILAAAALIMIGEDVMLGYYKSRESVIFQLLDIPYFVIYFLFFQAGQEFVGVKKEKRAQ